MLADAARTPDALSTGLAALENCDWRAHGAWLGAVAALAADPAARIDHPAVVLHALAGGLDATVCAKLLDAHLRAVQQPSAPYPRTDRLPRKHLRVGYLANPARSAHRGSLLEGLLEHHDRERIEPIVYALEGLDQRLATVCNTNRVLLRPIAHLKPHEAQGLIRVDDIDILVDLCGLSDPRATTLLLSQPARLHAHLAVHASAAARALLPVAQLPALAPGAAPDAQQRSSSGLPEDGAILCSLAPAWALGPDTFGAWMEALSAVANSHLLLCNIGAAAQAHLRSTAGRMNIAPSRLHFAAAQSPLDMLAIAHAADVFAEPLHASDGVDAIIAQASAMPLVAPSDATRSMRPGAASLDQAGLDEYAATDRAGYVTRITSLLGNPEARARARQRFASAWRHDQDARFAAWVRALESRLDSAYAERVSLASAKGR